MSDSDDQSGDDRRYTLLPIIATIFTGVGFLLLTLDLIGAIGSIYYFLDSYQFRGKDQTVAVATSVLVGLVVAFLSLSIIATGQVINCFLDIEKNTRTTRLLLEEGGAEPTDSEEG